jgi:hypothetical protein
MEEWVFVDTCIWASFFDKPSSPEKVAVDDLLDTDRVALLGPIVAEILSRASHILPCRGAHNLLCGGIDCH